MKVVVLLVISNVFMTLAWYGHLKFKRLPLAAAIFLSWGVALAEYAFQVPANRVGADRFSVTQLKIMQECITLVVFTLIAYVMFGETPRWNLVVSYALIIAAVFFAFKA
ncbi:MAG: DMT family protein [Pyrinomonadaceae bacterium]